jgi:type IV pilus assembly protein PilM
MISLLRRGKSSVGLDIGSGFVKVVEIDHSGAEPLVSRVAHAPLMADAIVDGEVMDPHLVADTVRSLLASLDLKPRALVTGVGGRDVIIKRIQMDRMAESDAREVIRWEAEQYVPFDMENVQLDFEILDPMGTGLQMNVLLVAAKREVVDHKVNLLRDAGLQPSVVDVDAFALHNAFEYNYPEAMQGTVALVNVGHEITNVNVLQDGSPVLTREIPFGSRRLREDLRRMHNLSPEDADAVVEGRSGRSQEFRKVLDEGSSELAVGIERAVAFLSINDAEGRVGRIYLCGGASGVPGLKEIVAEHLAIPVQLANPLQRLQVKPEVASRFPVEELAPMLMLAVGLALRSSN